MNMIERHTAESRINELKIRAMQMDNASSRKSREAYNASYLLNSEAKVDALRAEANRYAEARDQMYEEVNELTAALAKGEQS